MGNSFESFTLSGDAVERVRTRLERGVRPWTRSKVMEEIRRLSGPAVQYRDDSRYFIYMTTYLRQEGAMPDRDWHLADLLNDFKRRPADALPRGGVVPERLRPELYDMVDVRREFHSGGPLADPHAEAGFLEALRVLRLNFEQVDKGGMLLWWID